MVEQNTSRPALGSAVSQKQLGDGTTPTAPSPVKLTETDLVALPAEKLREFIAAGEREDASAGQLRLALACQRILSLKEKNDAASTKGKGRNNEPGRFAPLKDEPYRWVQNEARMAEEKNDKNKFGTAFRPAHVGLLVNKGEGAGSAMTVYVGPGGGLNIQGLGGGFAGFTINEENLKVLLDSAPLLKEFCQKNAAVMKQQRAIAEKTREAKDAAKKK